MTNYPFNQSDLDVLAQWDTPTICNGLEIVVPERRAIGFTVEPMVCIDPKAKPIVGLARVGMIRSTEAPRGKVTDRADWYDYVARVDFPTIAVHPGHRRPRSATAPIGAKSSRPYTRRWARSAASPTVHSATSTCGRRVIR